MYIKLFEAIRKEDVLEAGGKGASLGEMTQAGIPVPGGFVVLSSAFKSFVAEAGILSDIESLLSKVEQEKIYTIETASEQIEAIIMQAEVSQILKNEVTESFKGLQAPFVAVRSSATAEDGVNAAWAGQLNTYLNTTEENLIENIKRCWASLFSPRAIFYRIEKGLHKEDIAVAVVVQKMIQSEVSGVAFSVHPINQDRNQILIEAGYGLGEAVVSGAITPDNYVVEKNTLNILTKHISKQDKELIKNGYKNEWTQVVENKQELQKISDDQIKELSELVVKIENHYGFPCDIEWGLFEEKLYILQSRPITTLNFVTNNQPVVIEEKWHINRTRYIPALWPVNIYFNWPFSEYYNLEYTGQVMHVFQKGQLTAVWDKKLFDTLKEVIFKQLIENKDEIDTLRQSGLQTGQKLVEYVKQFASSLNSNQPIDNYIAFFNGLTQYYNQFIKDNMIYWLLGASSIEERINHKLERFDDSTRQTIFQKLSSTQDSYSAQEEKEFYRLIDVARESGLKSETLNQKVEEFVQKYFWFPYEYVGPEIWDKEKILKRVSEELDSKSSHTNKEISNEERDLYIKENKLDQETEDYFRILRALSLMQDDRKMINAQVCYYLNGVIFSVLAKQLNISLEHARYIDISLLEEIKNNEDESWRDILIEREKFSIEVTNGHTTNILVGTEAEEFLKENNIKISFEGKVTDLKGFCAQPGLVTGRVRVLHSSQVSDFKEGDIIVTGMTTPDFVPLVKKASAIITNEGGVTCHAAIVSRELGKPCIIGTKIATQVLKDGDLVEVDATNGIVKIIESVSKDSLFDITKDILDTKWSHLGKWVEPALAAELWLSYTDTAQEFFSQKLDKKILYLNGDFFLSEHDSEIYKSEGYEAAKSHNKEFFQNIYDKVVDVTEWLSNEVQNINSSVQFLEDYKKLTGVWMPLNNIALGVEKYVQETNPEAFNCTKGFLDKKPWSLEQLDEMFALKDRIEASIGKPIRNVSDIPNQFEEDVKKHVEKYCWISSHTFNVCEWTLENLIERMQQEQKVPSDALNKKEKEFDYLVWLLDLIGYVRFKAAETSGYTTYYFKDTLEKLAQEKGLGYLDIVEHTVEEINSGNISKEVVEQRKTSTGFYFDGKEIILSKEQTETCEKGLLNVDTVHKDELKGLAAHPGKVTGRVKVVIRQDQMQGFEEGMILVAYETTPDIIFAMQKCGAVVTDFGGLTSHAAITSRELGKPCIVGTKIATQVLKDGDFVEVDANRGVITILTNTLKVENYQRLFRGSGAKLLLSDLFMQYYKNLRGLCFLEENTWWSFLPKDVVEQTLNDGVQIYTNSKNFTQFDKDFRNYLQEADKTLSEILKKENLTKTDVEHFIKVAVHFWFYFSKTEFFYTDRAYQKGSDKIDIKKYEAIKNTGREFLNKMSLENKSYFNVLIEKVAQQFNLSPEEVGNYTLDEFKSIFDGKKVEKLELLNRITYITNGKDDVVEIFTGKKAKEILSKFWGEKKEETTVKGSIANTGKVQGKARVIKYNFGDFQGMKNQIAEMENGEVLIAETTSPEYLIACKKASAIITDQGGLMTHAAIVSREFGIPCIVATGNATDLIKTGDFIEVDAYTGIVKVIH